MSDRRDDEAVLAEALAYCSAGLGVGGSSQRLTDALAALNSLALRLQNAETALREIRSWDMLDTASDGPYWKRRIDAALASSAEREPEKMACGCRVGKHGRSLTEIAKHHSGNAWLIRDLLLAAEREPESETA